MLGQNCVQRVEEHVFQAAEGLCSLRRQARSWLSHTSTAHAQSPRRLLQLEAKYQTETVRSVMGTVDSASRESWQSTSKDVPSLYDCSCNSAKCGFRQLHATSMTDSNSTGVPQELNETPRPPDKAHDALQHGASPVNPNALTRQAQIVRKFQDKFLQGIAKSIAQR